MKGNNRPENRTGFNFGIGSFLDDYILCIHFCYSLVKFAIVFLILTISSLEFYNNYTLRNNLQIRRAQS